MKRVMCKGGADSLCVCRRNFEEIPWYAEKGNVRAYLAEINKDKKVVFLPHPIFSLTRVSAS